MVKGLRQRYPYSLAIFWVTSLILSSVLCADLYAAEMPKLEASIPPVKSAELFNTMEFRGSLKALEVWQKLIIVAKQQVTNYETCSATPVGCNAAALSWQQMLTTAQHLAPAEQLKWVNHFFNRWPYRLDLEAYGQSDYWASPNEFMSSSGDCEDFSITKYFALRQLGYSADQLRIVVLKDKIRDIGHAVLAVDQNGQFQILDNMSDLVLPQDRYKHYQPQYSVNELYRWAHIRKFKKFSINPLLKGSKNAK